MKRPTPDAEIQYEHDAVCNNHIYCDQFDDEMLSQILGQAPIQYQQATLPAPLNAAHALFDQKDRLAAPGSLADLRGSQIDRICWIDEVCFDRFVDI